MGTPLPAIFPQEAEVEEIDSGDGNFAVNLAL